MTVTYPPEADIGSLPPSPQDMKFVTIYCLDTTLFVHLTFYQILGSPVSFEHLCGMTGWTTYCGVRYESTTNDGAISGSWWLFHR